MGANNVKQTIGLIRGMGLTVGRKNGEYRINYRGATDDTAYYTTDHDDALETAIAMLEWKAMWHRNHGKAAQ